MKSQQVVRALGVAAILGGGARVIASFIPELQDEIARESFYLAIDLGLLFGLVGFYFVVAPSTGKLGFIGFLIAGAGTALITGPDGTFLQWDVYRTGSAVIAVGLLTLSFALFLNGVHVLPGMFWVLAVTAAVAGPYLGFEPLSVILTGTLFGLGYVVAGLSAVTHQ